MPFVFRGRLYIQRIRNVKLPSRLTPSFVRAFTAFPCVPSREYSLSCQKHTRPDLPKQLRQSFHLPLQELPVSSFGGAQSPATFSPPSPFYSALRIFCDRGLTRAGPFPCQPAVQSAQGPLKLALSDLLYCPGANQGLASESCAGAGSSTNSGKGRRLLVWLCPVLARSPLLCPRNGSVWIRCRSEGNFS